MSRAFVKEVDGDDAADKLPERMISEHPNFVTGRGLWMIEDCIQQLEQGREAARLADDASSLVHINRDLRYWQQRLANAQLIHPNASPTKVRFGVTVALTFVAGMKRHYTLVGEDEAEPADGLISYLSPVAKALLGHQVGDEVELLDGRAKITALSVRQ